MRRVRDYRQNACECRELAAKMPDAQRQQLLDMAAQWERIADEREDAILRAKTLPLEPRPYTDS